MTTTEMIREAAAKPSTRGVDAKVEVVVIPAPRPSTCGWVGDWTRTSHRAMAGA
ncbi:hypothetical protein SAMN05216338_1014168 [Bradyrhizobium sp. Rc2d]|nr:hypothetical protein SAMN05216338_1014168 [Bradyrhizobium sp. Rc2d]